MGAHLAAIVCHVGAVVLLTWPLAIHLGSHRPDTTGASAIDYPFVAWALAHESHALLTSPLELPHGNIYHPTPHALFYGEAGFGAVPYFLPSFALTGNPTLALNLLLLVCSAATAWAVHVVVTRMTASWSAGLVAGWLYLNAPYTLWGWTATAPSYGVVQYIPFILLLTARPSVDGRRSTSLLALLALQFLTSAYVAVAVAVPLATLAVVRLARAHTRSAGARLLGVLALAALVAFPFYAGYLLVRLENPQLPLQTNWLLGATIPLPQRFGSLFYRVWPADLPTVCYPVIAIGATLRWARRRPEAAQTPAWAWRCGAFWAFVGTIMGMRPVVDIGGVTWSTPTALVAHWTSLYDIIRVPERLAVAGRIGHVVLVGLSFAECLRVLADTRLGRHRAIGPVAVAAVLYAGMLQWPGAYPLTQMRAPDPVLVKVVRSHPGPLLELPAGIQPAKNVGAMYRSIYHGQPILNGYSGYWPSGFPARMALARQLPSADALARLSRDTGLTSVLVHTDRLPPRQRRTWLALAAHDERSPFDLETRRGPVLLFSVRRTHISSSSSRAVGPSPPAPARRFGQSYRRG